MPNPGSTPAHAAGHASRAEVPTGTDQRDRHPVPPAAAGFRRSTAPP
ncbi:hypothetical protein [Burkholderia pseudomultivorans]|nr:hypothetical protein [Burkholderia pseudomultivorans]EGD05847.1 hypothetical protein B1M_04369 [Burkholderia sp. TJI49]